MKLHLGIIGIFGILLVLLAAMVSAKVELSNANELVIPVDYGDLNDNDNEFVFENHNIILKNTGTAAENVIVSITGLNSGYTNFKLDGSTTLSKNITLNSDGTESITISGEIPVGLDVGKTSSFGKLNVGSDSFDLTAEIESMLELKNIYVFINDIKEKNLNDEGDTISDLTPGDKVELRFGLDNKFDNDYNDGDIDGTITIQLDDSDFGEDIDEDIDFTLGAGDNTGESDGPMFSFTIPSDADENDYTLEITIDADDDNNANYEINWNIDISVDRKSDDVRIEQMQLLPAEVSCSRKFVLSTKVTNYGSDSQKYGSLNLISSDLGIDQKYDFTLDSGTSNNNFAMKEYTGEAKADLAPGTYTITGKAFYDYTTISDLSEAKLVVKECVKPTKTASNVTENKSAEVITSTINLDTKGATAKPTTTAPAKTAAATTNAPTTDGNQLSSAVIAQIIESPYSADDYILAGLVVAIILMLVLIVLFIVVLQK
jgi:hypothetical protein